MGVTWSVRCPAFFLVAFLLAASPARADFDAGRKAFGRGDYAAARKEFEPLAGKGEPKAQYYLGRMYRGGKGVPKDLARALGG